MVGKLVNCELQSNGGRVKCIVPTEWTGWTTNSFPVYFFPEIIRTVLLINPFITKRYPFKDPVRTAQ